MRGQRPLRGFHTKQDPFSSPTPLQQQTQRHVTVTATSSFLSGHVELNLKDTKSEHCVEHSGDSVTEEQQDQCVGVSNGDGDAMGNSFQIFDESGTATDSNIHGTYAGGPPPPSAIKSRRPLNNVSNRSCTSTPSLDQNNGSVSSSKNLDKSKKWEERMLNLGLTSMEANDASPLMSAKNSSSSVAQGVETSVPNPSGAASSSDADDTGRGMSADYVQFDLHASQNIRGTKLSPRSQEGLFSPSSRDQFPHFNGASGRGVGTDHENNDASNQDFFPGNNRPPRSTPVENYNDLTSPKVEEGRQSYVNDSLMNITVQAKTRQEKGNRKSPNQTRTMQIINSKPPLHQGSRSSISPASFARNKSQVKQSSLDSIGSSSVASSIEIAECVADVMDQLPTGRSLSQVSVASSNVTAEIAECVADVIEQDMPSLHSSDTNSTREVAECVADIMEQSIASSDRMDSNEFRKKQLDERRNIKNVETEAPLQHSRNVQGISDTQTTVEIAECVADLLEQTMAHDSMIETAHTRIRDFSRSGASPLPSSLKSPHLCSDKNSFMANVAEGKTLPMVDTDTMRQEQKDRVSRLLQAMTKPPPPPPHLSPASAAASSHSDNKKASDEEKAKDPLDTDNSDSSVFGPFSLSDSSSSTSEDKQIHVPSSDSYSSDSIGTDCAQLEIISPPPSSSKGIRAEMPKAAKTRISVSRKKKFEVLSAEASHHLSGGRYKDALNAFQNLLQCQVSVLGATHPLVASTNHNIGIAHTKCALVAKNIADEEMCNMLALKSFQNAAIVAREALGPNHPNVAVSLVRIGLILLQAGQYPESIVTFQECLRIRKIALGNKHPLVARVYNNLGVAHLHIDDYELSLKEFESACGIHRLSVESISKECNNQSADLKLYQAELELADSLSNIGSICLDWVEKNDRSNRLAERSDLCTRAIVAFNEAMDLRVKRLGTEHELVKDLEQLRFDAEDMLRGGPKTDLSDTITAVSVLAIPSSEKKATQSLKNTPPPHRSISSTTNSSSCDFVDEESCLMSSSRIESSMSPWEESSTTASKSTSMSEQASRQMLLVRPVQCDSSSSQKSIQSKDSDTTSIKGVDEWDPFDNGTSDDYPLPPLSPNVSPVSNFEGVSQRNKSTVDPFSPSLIHARQNNAFEGSFSEGVNLGTDDMLYDVSFTSNKNVERSTDNPPASSSNVGNSLITPTQQMSPSTKTSSPRPINEYEMMADPRKYSLQMEKLASQYLKEEKLAKSLSLFKFLLQFYRSEHGTLHPDIGSTLHNIGTLYLRSKDHALALESFQQAVRVRRGAIGRDHADVAVSLVKVGITQLLLRNFDDALYSFREALSVRRHALGHLHPSTARIYNNIGCVHVEFNEMREARRAFESALDVQLNALCYEPNSAPLLFGAATTLCNLGYLYTFRGLHAKACLVLHEAMVFQERVLGPLHPTVLSILDSLADSYEQSGETGNALKSYRDIVFRLEDRKRQGHELSSQKKRAVGTVFYKMSLLLRKQNDLDAALRLLTDSWHYFHELGASDWVQTVNNELIQLKKSLKHNDFDWV